MGNMKKSTTILLLLCSMAVITSCSNKQIGEFRLGKVSKVGGGKLYLRQDSIGNSMMLESDSVNLIHQIGSGLKYEGSEFVPTPGNGKTVFYSDIQSDTDTTVLNSGDATTIHLHEWAYKKMQFSRNTCAVYHGDLGCPNNLPVSFRICSVCLRHERISTTYRYVDKVDKYDEALKRIND